GAAGAAARAAPDSDQTSSSTRTTRLSSPRLSSVVSRPLKLRSGLVPGLSRRPRSRARRQSSSTWRGPDASRRRVTAASTKFIGRGLYYQEAWPPSRGGSGRALRALDRARRGKVARPRAPGDTENVSQAPRRGRNQADRHLAPRLPRCQT